MERILSLVTPRLDDQLCFALYSASRAVIAAYQPILNALDITYPQYLVLLVLWEEDGCRVTRLGERLELDSGTLSPLLKRLEARGLVERRRREDDERVVEIWLTRAGKALEKRGQEVQDAAFCNAKLTLTEAQRLRDSLKRLTMNLNGEER